MDWEKLVKNLGPRLYRYFAASFSDIVADDLTQETLLRIVRKYQEGQIDNTKGSMDMLSFGIAKNVRYEHLRSLKNTDSIHDFDDSHFQQDDGSFEVLNQHQQTHRLRLAISKLGNPQKDILLLTIDQELTSLDIAKILEIPEGTIKSHIHRAKEELRNLLL
jgi:RNA polymerase sigma-70 factor, ECF subfamily